MKVARKVSAIAIPLMFTPQFAYAAAPDFDFDELPLDNPAVTLGAGVALLVAGRYIYTYQTGTDFQKKLLANNFIKDIDGYCIETELASKGDDMALSYESFVEYLDTEFCLD